MSVKTLHEDLVEDTGSLPPPFDYKFSVAQFAYFHIDFPKDTSFEQFGPHEGCFYIL